MTVTDQDHCKDPVQLSGLAMNVSELIATDPARAFNSREN